MIQPIRQNVAFKAQIPATYQAVANSQPQPEFKQVSEPQQSTARRAKNGFINFLKGFNNVKDTMSGAVRGAVEGVAMGSLVGVFGHNYKKQKGEFFATLGGTIKDIASEGWKFVRNIPSIITKRTPWNTISTIAKEPFKQMKKLKGNTPTIIAASATALAILAFRTVQGKIKANKANANIDHSFNEGHIPTK